MVCRLMTQKDVHIKYYRMQTKTTSTFLLNPIRMNKINMTDNSSRL